MDSGIVRVTRSAALTLPSNEHDEHATEHDRTTDPTKCRRYKLRLVVHDAQLDAVGKRSANVLDGCAYSSSDGDRVCAELLDDPSADDLALESMAGF
jgi:hypothetical protein